MENFTPWLGLAGGLLIGAGASLLAAMNGRVAGVSGVYRGVLWPKARDWAWRAAFIAGILLGALAVQALGGGPERVAVTESWPLLLIAGLLVGFGVSLGNGCTSGHGVCGLARGSVRSLVATGTFFVTAVVTVFVVRQIGG